MIDASGSDGFLARHLALPSSLGDLKTYSRGLFSHFHGVHSWQSILAAGGNDTSDHTFPCNAAALHHVFKGGWMYLLEFENGVTSAGFSLDPRLHPQPSSMSPEEEWRQWLNRFPSIAEQFADAEPIAPAPEKSFEPEDCNALFHRQPTPIGHCCQRPLESSMPCIQAATPTLCTVSNDLAVLSRSMETLFDFTPHFMSMPKPLRAKSNLSMNSWPGVTNTLSDFQKWCSPPCAIS